MILIGELSLWVALLMAAWSAITSFAAGKTRRSDLALSGQRAVHATWVLVLAAAAGLWTALFTHDFSFRFVSTHTSANLPALYLFASLWAGPAGSLLLLVLILSTCSLVAVPANRSRVHAHALYATGTLATVMFFLLLALCFAANPYERLEWMPTDGSGLQPILQSSGMAVHPPLLYLGLVATAIPFAHVVGALLAGRVNSQLQATVHRWSLAGWFFMTLGIILGMRWAYQVPALNGAWMWDPAKNGSLWPWLALSVVLSLKIARRELGMLRWWEATLIASSFILVLLALFAGKGGVIAAVHGFSQPPLRGWFAAFFAVATATMVFLVLGRSGKMRGGEATQPLSTPRQRRYGVSVMSAGLVVLLVGLAGQAWRTERDIRLKAGESVGVRDPFGGAWTLTSQGMSRSQSLNREVTEVALQVSRDGRPIYLVSSERRQYVDSRNVATYEPATTSGIRSSALEDLYVVLVNVSDEETADIRVAFNPLVAWVWVGGAIVAVAGVLLMWPASTFRVE